MKTINADDILERQVFSRDLREYVVPVRIIKEVKPCLPAYFER